MTAAAVGPTRSSSRCTPAVRKATDRFDQMLDVRISGFGIAEHQAARKFAITDGEVGGLSSQEAQSAVVVFQLRGLGEHMFFSRANLG